MQLQIYLKCFDGRMWLYFYELKFKFLSRTNPWKINIESNLNLLEMLREIVKIGKLFYNVSPVDLDF